MNIIPLGKIKEGATNRGVPIVMVTADGQELNKKLAQSLGAAGYITKPLQSAVLLEVVRDLLPIRNGPMTVAVEYLSFSALS